MPIYYINCYKLIIQTCFIAEEALNEGPILAMYMCTCIRMYVCTYVHVCNAQECQFALICTYVHIRSGTHASRALTIEVPVEDKEERHFLTMEDAEDSATGHLQCTCFAQLSAERSRRLATLRKRKQRTKSMYSRSQEGKKRMRESAKEKSTLWRVFTSQV